MRQLIENTGYHIGDIISRTECRKHSANKYDPCWSVRFDAVRGLGFAVCGARITKAGFVGKISEEAMRKTAAGKRYDGKPSSRYKGRKPTTTQ